jgi:hypothetical protein
MMGHMARYRRGKMLNDRRPLDGVVGIEMLDGFLSDLFTSLPVFVSLGVHSARSDVRMN